MMGFGPAGDIKMAGPALTTASPCTGQFQHTKLSRSVHHTIPLTSAIPDLFECVSPIISVNSLEIAPCAETK